MFGLIDLVVRAERDLRDAPVNLRPEPRFELWLGLLLGLWRHKRLLLATAGVLALLIIGGNAL